MLSAVGFYMDDERELILSVFTLILINVVFALLPMVVAGMFPYLSIGV